MTEMIGSLNSEFKFMQDALDLRAYRQQVLASNIANSDTPNYKARDVDFAKELQRAQGMQVGKLDMSTTSSGHLQVPGGVLNAQPLYRTAVQPSIDGNTVDMDQERAQFTDNAIHYQFLIEQMRNKFSEMISAVKE
ncbi:MAG: flagellar basal body rod protein FlgB [Sulfuricella sp.]|nr:flagellar basal body rod protein FlgB [Sulfuricella sp.]